MVVVSMKVEGKFARLKRRFRKIPAETRKAFRAQLKVNTEELMTAQRRVAHKASTRLANSIRDRDFSTAWRIARRVYAGGTATTKPVGNPQAGGKYQYDYALANEWGTKTKDGEVKMAAQPFFFPPYRFLRSKFKKSMRDISKAALYKAAQSS